MKKNRGKPKRLWTLALEAMEKLRKENPAEYLRMKFSGELAAWAETEARRQREQEDKEQS